MDPDLREFRRSLEYLECRAAVHQKRIHDMTNEIMILWEVLMDAEIRARRHRHRKKKAPT